MSLNKNTIYQNSWVAAKAVSKEKLILVNANLDKEKT